jgi:stage IV sporulation protein FB
MRWSIKITTLFDIPIKVHASFLILLALIGMSASGPSGVILTSLVFVCVLLHELGHSLVARRFGVEVESITLLPIGGVAAMKTPPRTAKAELLIALAGPAVSVLLAVGFALLAVWRYDGKTLLTIARHQGVLPLIGELAMINFILAGFNLIPAFPMDGGRVLRAVLWSKKGFYRATRIAVNVGQGLAIGFFLASLVGHFSFWMIFIAVFIYFGAEAEGRAAAWRESISDVPIADAMQRQVQPLSPDATVEQAVDIMLNTNQEHFPVIAGGEPVGVLTKSAILSAIRLREGGRRISEIMTPQLHYCTPFDTLANVVEMMDKRNLMCVLVLYENKIVGMITPEQIWRFRAMRQRTAESAKC